jgi:class 3 adenylate cyclase
MKQGRPCLVSISVSSPKSTRLSPRLIDVALSVALIVAVAIGISVGPEQGGPPATAAYLLAPVIGVFALFRTRWPLGILVVTAVSVQVYNLFDNPGIFAAVPLSVALATAWAAGRRLASLLVTVWFIVGPLVYVVVEDLREDVSTRLVNGLVSDVALMAAILLLGEAVRNRRALNREHTLLLAEQQRSEALLLNVLPASIAVRLRQEEHVIADQFDDVTVMFADLVDFTPSSENVDADELVRELNDLFSAFDRLAQRHALEKIKTIGDAYMVAGGLPEPRPDHAEAVADLALAIRDEVTGHLDPKGRTLAIRIGIDTGPVVAGVIGQHKFSYDLWGDTVNTASRMESHGVAGKIQVTERTYQRLRDNFLIERRGPIDVKGKGEMVTWFLIERMNTN